METRIAKTSTNRDVAHAPSLFYDSAREGLQDLLTAQLELAADVRVLLPSFIGWSPTEGSGVLDPITHLGLKPAFYKLNRDLSVDLYDLERCLSTDRRPTVLLLIHYFGRTQPELPSVAMLARRSGAILVEDLAHGFFSSSTDGPAGRFGDVLLYSLHKMFPTPRAQGGMMTYNDPKLLTSQRSTRRDLAEFLLDYDWRRIAGLRRQAFALTSASLFRLAEGRTSSGRAPGFEVLWPSLESTDVPQTLPVRVLTGNRDAVYRRLNNQGFGMVSLYHTLVPELAGDVLMNEVSRTIINFPVHQDVNLRLIPDLVTNFGRALDSGESA